MDQEIGSLFSARVPNRRTPYLRADDECQARRALRQRLESTYLKHILLHLGSDDPDDRPLRTYLDSWFAYHRGGALLDAAGRHEWMNRGDLEVRPWLAGCVHAVSEAAENAIRAGNVSQLARDHSVPKAAIVSELLGRTWASVDQLRSFLVQWYTVAVLTQEQHRMLSQLDRTEPVLFSDDFLASSPTSRFARYCRPTCAFAFRTLGI